MVTTTQQLTTKYHIKVDGADLPEDQIHRVDRVVVEQSLHLPDMCVIYVQDVGTDQDSKQVVYFRILDQNAFKIGASLEVAMGRADAPDTVFKGEITAIELDAGTNHPPALVVRGYAKSHRLHRGRQNKSYLNVSDSDLAKQIAQSAGLSAQVDATTVIHDYVFQTNQTGWEFLKARAARIGYELFVDGSILHFRKPQRDQDMTPDLKLWETLLRLQVKMSSAFQSDTVVVQGWDPKTKTPIVGTATKGQLAPEIGFGKTGAATSSGFGGSKVYVVNQPVDSQSEADLLAKAVYDSLDGSFIQAEGTCIGEAAIRPGRTVKMPNIGQNMSGKYYITSATHEASQHEGYTTTFVVSGRQSNSLLELAQPSGQAGSGNLPSVVVGVVTNNQDPQDWGRVKVKFPWLSDSDESWWARIASPMAGPGRGFFYLPEVEDEVLVAFEHGDIAHAYVIGALWNGKDSPPKKNSQVVTGSLVNERIIKTRAGHIINLIDTQGSESIQIIDKTGKNFIKIESSDNKISITSEGDTVVTTKGKTIVNATQNVEVTTQADAKVTAQGNINATATGNVDVEAQGNATVKATGNADVEGLATTVKANAALTLKGATVDIESQGMMTVKSTGVLTIQGSLVNIN